MPRKIDNPASIAFPPHDAKPNTLKRSRIITPIELCSGIELQKQTVIRITDHYFTACVLRPRINIIVPRARYRGPREGRRYFDNAHCCISEVNSTLRKHSSARVKNNRPVRVKHRPFRIAEPALISERVREHERINEIHRVDVVDEGLAHSKIQHRLCRRSVMDQYIILRCKNMLLAVTRNRNTPRSHKSGAF